MKNQTERRASERNYYVDGNTVRRMEAVPDYRRERREREEREREEQLRRRKRQVKKKSGTPASDEQEVCGIPYNGSDSVWRVCRYLHKNTV